MVHCLLSSLLIIVLYSITLPHTTYTNVGSITLYNSKTIHAHTIDKIPVHAYNHHSPKQANTKLHTLTLHIHLCMAMFIFYTMHLTTYFNLFDHAHWVAVRCETSEATPMVAEVSEAPCKGNCNCIVYYTK